MVHGLPHRFSVSSSIVPLACSSMYLNTRTRDSSDILLAVIPVTSRTNRTNCSGLSCPVRNTVHSYTRVRWQWLMKQIALCNTASLGCQQVPQQKTPVCVQVMHTKTIIGPANGPLRPTVSPHNNSTQSSMQVVVSITTGKNGGSRINPAVKFIKKTPRISSTWTCHRNWLEQRFGHCVWDKPWLCSRLWHQLCNRLYRLLLSSGHCFCDKLWLRRWL